MIADSLKDSFESIFYAVAGIPDAIWTIFKDSFNNLIDLLRSTRDFIFNLPTLVIEGIKAIFIPDTVEIENSFNAFLDTLKMKFNFNTDFFESVLTDSAPVEDVNKDYYIHGVGNMNLKFFDSSFLYDGVEYFRPFIRGFLVLLMAFYNVKQTLSFIRQDAGVVTGKVASGKGD